MQYNQPWHGFTLQQGHLFGEDEWGYFVSAAKPGRCKDTIQVYRCDTSSGDYVWYSTNMSVSKHPTAQKIIEAAGTRECKVTYEPIEKQARRLIQPRLTVGAYTPMKHMSIPNPGHGKHETRMVKNAI
jgi:hypothetical protein